MTTHGALMNKRRYIYEALFMCLSIAELPMPLQMRIDICIQKDTKRAVLVIVFSNNLSGDNNLSGNHEKRCGYHNVEIY